MRNKIIVSLLLVLLLAISASAVSASEDGMDTITETSSMDLEDGLADTSIDNDDQNDELIVDENAINNLDNKKLTTGATNTTWGINTVQNLKDYTKKEKASDGDILDLKDKTFNLTEAIKITASITIKGGTIRTDENLSCFFIIDSPANGGPSSVTIKDTTFIVTKDQNIVNAGGKIQGTNNVLNIAGITLQNITINIQADIDYLPENNALLYVDAINLLNLTSNEINIANNKLYGLKSINFANALKNDDDFYSEATKIVFLKSTRIVLNSDIIFAYAVDTAVGDSPIPFQVELLDEDNNAVVNKTVYFALDGVDMLSAITDEKGIATVLLNLNESRIYSIYTIFNESDEYKSSNMVANTINVTKKVSKLTVKNVSYKVTATKKLYATFKDQNGKLIKNKKVTFTVNGKTYTAKTYSNGVAAVQINLNKKGTYTFTAKFAGDDTYSEVTQKGKLTVVPLATSLTTKKYTFKRYAKTKKLATVLKSGKTVLKYQKVVFRVNGRNYVAKTNYRGIATVNIALTKKGTFKYSVKYAGTNTYNTVTRYNYVVITK